MEQLCCKQRLSCQLNSIITPYKFVQRFALMLFTISIIFGCGQDIQDLQQYVDEVKSRKSSRVESLPEIKPYQKFEYKVEGLRNPFDASELTVRITQSNKPKSTVSPVPDRPPQYLETFPLDTLRMVGTLSQGDDLWALIKTPDSTIQRVKAGDFMGQNHGKVISINEEKISLSEIVPDGYGGWRKRDTLVALME